MYNMGYITKNHAGRNISAASGLLVSAKRGEGCILVFDKPVKKCANCLVMCDKLINTHTHTHTHTQSRAYFTEFYPNNQVFTFLSGPTARSSGCEAMEGRVWPFVSLVESKEV